MPGMPARYPSLPCTWPPFSLTLWRQSPRMRPNVPKRGQAMDESARQIADEIIKLVTTYGLDVVGAIVILIVGWIAAGWSERITVSPRTSALCRSNATARRLPPR